VLKCPIDYVKDNLIFAADKSCWAVFELQGFDYDLLSTENKMALLNRLTLFISGVTSEAKFMLIPVIQDLESHYKRLKQRLSESDVLYDYASNYSEATKGYLINGGGDEAAAPANLYKTFVSIKLQKDSAGDVFKEFKDYLNFFFKAVFNDINALAGIDTKDIAVAKVQGFEKLSEQIYAEQTRRIVIEPVDGATLWWLLRRNMFRSLQEDGSIYAKRYEKRWRQYHEEVQLIGDDFIRPYVRDIENCFNGAICKKGRSLAVSHNDSTSYQTFITLTSIPEELRFPGSEWIYLLQQMNINVEIYVHIKNMEHSASIREIDKKRREANSQIENIEKAKAEIPQDLEGSKEEIELLEAELKATHAPLTTASITICVTAASEEELDRKAADIIREYRDMNFTVERPLAGQLPLFMHCLPCVGFTMKDYNIRLTPQALASGVIGATQELGDDEGMYIGTTGQKNVFLNLARACLLNMSASAVFYGNLGVGKSFNANLLALLHVIMGGYGLIIDPKGERTHWVEKMPFSQDLITLVTLSADMKYRGMLDPFNIFNNYSAIGSHAGSEEDGITLACELAKNIVSELFGLTSKDEQYIVLTEVISEMKSKGYEDVKPPSMVRLVELLEDYPKDDPLYMSAYLLARRIKPLRTAGMAQLFIGDGTEKSIRIDNRLNILQIQNLKMPSPDSDKDDYTDEERVSSVLMMVIAAFTRRFVHSHKNSFKVVLFDESWMLGKTAEGEKLMSYVARMSRSLYASLILNGHSVTDLPNEGIRNTITYKFCFKTGSMDEARRMLDFLKLEKTKNNIELIMGLGNAQCLFQDLAGRVGVLQFDAVFSDIIDLFSTTPIDASELINESQGEFQNQELEEIVV
jgi:hypothetical protein